MKAAPVPSPKPIGRDFSVPCASKHLLVAVERAQLAEIANSVLVVVNVEAANIRGRHSSRSHPVVIRASMIAAGSLSCISYRILMSPIKRVWTD